MGNRIKVVFFQRKPYPFHKSLEFIFDDVRQRMPESIESVKYVFTEFSKGIFPRISIIKESNRNQGTINHITGDIHFAAIGLPKRNTLITVLDCRMLSDSKGIKHALLKYFWFTLPLKFCRYVTVISEATKRELLKYANYPGENIHVIPVAISTSYVFNPKPFNKKKPRILQVGTTVNKNIARLVEAVKAIECSIQFIGELAPEHVELLNVYGIEFISNKDVGEDELIKAYSQCDIVSFVSTYEGFGMPIIEANAVGRVVVTSNILSMPEVASDAACLVDPFNTDSIRDGISRVINDDMYREELINNGKSNCARFEPQKIADMYLALYQTMAETPL